MAARLMRAEGHWAEGADDAFFAYMDRWMTEDHPAELKAIIEAIPRFNSRVNERIIESGQMGTALTSPFMKAI
jgi:hypothetical protein